MPARILRATFACKTLAVRLARDVQCRGTMRRSLLPLLMLCVLPGCFRLVGDADSQAILKPEQQALDSCPAATAELKQINDGYWYTAQVGPCGDLSYFDGTHFQLRNIDGLTLELPGRVDDFDELGSLISMTGHRPEAPGTDNMVTTAIFMNLRDGKQRTPAASGGPERAGFGYDGARKQSYGVVYKQNVTRDAIERWSSDIVFAPVSVAAESELVAYARAGSLVIGREIQQPKRLVATDVLKGTSSILPITSAKDDLIWLDETGQILLVEQFGNINGPSEPRLGVLSTKLYRATDGKLLADLQKEQLIAMGQTPGAPSEVQEVAGTVIFSRPSSKLNDNPGAPTFSLAVHAATGTLLRANEPSVSATTGQFLGALADGRLTFATSSSPQMTGQSGNQVWIVDVQRRSQAALVDLNADTQDARGRAIAEAVSPDAGAVLYRLATTTDGAGIIRGVKRLPSKVPAFALSPYASGPFAQDGTAFAITSLDASTLPSLSAFPVNAPPRHVSSDPLVTIVENTAIYRPTSVTSLDGTPQDPMTIALGTYNTVETSEAAKNLAIQGISSQSSLSEIRPRHGRPRLLTLAAFTKDNKTALMHGVLTRN